MKILVTGGSGFIGIHLVSHLRKLNYEVLNLDIKPPLDGNNLDTWQEVSVLDSIELRRSFCAFQPKIVVHLAATTTQDAKDIEEFRVNIEGTENLVKICNENTVGKFFFVSTQYINSPGKPISDDLEELEPYGLYGLSKLIGERIVRCKLESGSWTILRPTNIWGPRHTILSNGLWKHIYNNHYWHARKDQSIKGYGFVENTVWQIEKLIAMDSSVTDKRTWYLMDNNILQRDWVNAFAQAVHKRDLREVPKFFLKIISELGELAIRFNMAAPIYRSRYRNLITSNPIPIEKSVGFLGPVPIGLKESMERTVAWFTDEFRSK